MISRKAFTEAVTVVLTALVIILLLTIIAILLTRSIVAPMAEAVEVAKRVAAVELTQEIHVTGHDEPAMLLTSLRTMQHSLRDTIRQISSASDQLASASKELHAVTEDTSRGLHQQSAEIDQAATAVNQMTAADEVRALAHRTQESTKEIGQMIGGIQSGSERAVGAIHSSQNRANNTLQVAQAAGDALEVIASSISSINERNLVIASASEEQAKVAREVDRNLVNIRDLSAQTSAGANQTSAASQDLSRLAVELNAMVSKFRT